MPPSIIITDGLVPSESGLELHPALAPWERYLLRRRRRWATCEDKTALAWYAAMLDVAPAALLAAKCKDIPESPKQLWVASAYHAQMGRDHVRVLPEGALPWTADDAEWLCELVNPLLKDDDMKLLPMGAALLFVCHKQLDVQPVSFAQVSGKLLPNRHPQGTDGGRLMRLLSEIQMWLHQHPAEHRQARGEPDINGVWLWGACDFPITSPQKTLPVATRNPFLQSVVDDRGAKLMITEAERLDELVKQDIPLPKKIVLAGEGHAVLLANALLPKFGKASWNPRSVNAEPELLSVLRGLA